MNVTAPFKLDAFAYATELSESAKRAGAANCLKFEGERVVAENFDGVGLVRDITVNLGVRMKGRRVLLARRGRRGARGRCCPSCARSRQSWFWSIAPCPKPLRWARNSRG